MSANLAIAQAQLLAPSDIALGDLERIFAQALGRGIERADLYFQHSRQESWVLEDGIVKEGSHSIEQGVGVRAISGEKTGFAYSDEIVLPALLEATHAARAIARDGRTTLPQALAVRSGHALYRPVDPVDSLEAAEKVSVLRELDALARSLDPRVTQVIVSLSGGVDTVLVAASDGVLAADVRPLVRLGVQVIATANGRREQGSAGAGGRYDYRELLGAGIGAEIVRDAVRQAITNLDAVDAPAGGMTVVLGSGWPGVLLHEAVGHGLEGDFNRKGLSAFSGRMGQQVAARGVTVVDDGTLPGRRGSLAIDDEGTPTQRNVLIEDGVLTGYLQDRMNAGLMGVAPTGNGRRESYASLPMPRMTNTFMLAGDADPQDLIRSVKRGLYAVNFGGGQVDITNGKFVFSASEAFLIEDGRVTAPVKGATLIGSGPETMTRIRGIGNDLALDRGVGVCGKDGQSVPVGVGQPTLLVDGLTVGGTRAG